MELQIPPWQHEMQLRRLRSLIVLDTYSVDEHLLLEDARRKLPQCDVTGLRCLARDEAQERAQAELRLNILSASLLLDGDLSSLTRLWR